MNEVLLFDVDSTLTPPRQPITQEMVRVLSRLVIPFHVAAGSHLALLEHQLLNPLGSHGYRGWFYAFVSNGANCYRCDVHDRLDVRLRFEFSIRQHLGEDDYRFLLNTLKEVLQTPEFALPADLAVSDERITDRVSMVNFVPMGRVTVEGPSVQACRTGFVAYDRTHRYRERLLDHLRQRLAPLAERHRLVITLGGQTSFDIGVKAQDKTVGVRTLLADGADRVVFIGDALFPGGNDEAILQFIREWPPGSACPAEAICVNSWTETISVLDSRGWLAASSR
jgi:phosphomannomutase